MNKKTLAIAEEALLDFMKKNIQEFKYYRGRIIKSETLSKPNQHMLSAAQKKVNWYKVELYDLEGELDMLREKIKQAEESENSGEQDG